MSINFKIRPIQKNDYAQWLPLWGGYNAFYGRSGATALPEEITKTTWERFFNPSEGVQACVWDFVKTSSVIVLQVNVNGIIAL